MWNSMKFLQQNTPKKANTDPFRHLTMCPLRPVTQRLAHVFLSLAGSGLRSFHSPPTPQRWGTTLESGMVQQPWPWSARSIGQGTTTKTKTTIKQKLNFACLVFCFEKSSKQRNRTTHIPQHTLKKKHHWPPVDSSKSYIYICQEACLWSTHLVYRFQSIMYKFETPNLWDLDSFQRALWLPGVRPTITIVCCIYWEQLSRWKEVQAKRYGFTQAQSCLQPHICRSLSSWNAVGGHASGTDNTANYFLAS